MASNKLQIYEHYLSASEKHQKFQRQYRLCRAEGEYRWILDTAVPQFAANGSFLDYISYAVDITDITDVKPQFATVSEDEAGLELALDTAQMEVWNRNIRVLEMTHQQEEIAVDLAKQELEDSVEERVKNLNEDQVQLQDRFFQLSLDMLCVAGFDGYFKLLNLAWEQTLGWTKAELKRLPFINFVHPDDREITLAYAQKLAQGIENVAFENRYRCKDGSYKWLLWTSRTLPEQQLIYAVARDISERKQTEEALQASYNLLNSVINNAADIILVKDIQGRYVMVNSAFARFFQKPIEEIIGKDDKEFFEAEIVSRIREIDLRVIATGVAETFEELIPQDGVNHTYLTTKNPWRDSQGNIIGLIAITRDISDRKRSEESLQALVAGTASVTGEEFFPALVRHLANALGVRYALVAEKLDQNLDRVVSLAFWEIDKPGENFDYELANTPCGVVYQDGVRCFARGLQQLFSQSQYVAAMKLESYLGTPIIDTFGNIIGHLCVFDTKPILQEEYAQAILKIFAARATAELQRQRVEFALRHSERKFRELASKESLLNRLASQIRASLDINTILETVVTEIRNLLQIDLCLFTWYCSEAQPPHWEIVQEARNPAVPSLMGLSSTTEEVGAIAQKIFYKEIIRLDEVQNIPEQQFFVGLGLTAILVLPIHTQSGEIGGLACNHFSGYRHWLDSEVELLLAVADQVAIAIDQAELYKQSNVAAQTAQEKAQQLEETLSELQATQTQLIQTEKMSSLGQLVAGIAHEINNPVNFIHGNINHASEYTQDLLRLVELYQQHYPNSVAEIQEEIEAIDLEFLSQDLPKILTSMKIGTDRIRQIVMSLRNFSRLDEADMKEVDIHEGIDNTLLLLQNRLKARSEHPEIQVIKEYANLPPVECYVGQLNQVFMNLLANAIDALEEGQGIGHRGLGITSPNPQSPLPQIHIRTQLQGNIVSIHIADNGPGMKEEIRQKLFDPFFTTKPVGKGTGMGLSISYKIIVEKHQGHLQCISAPGEGAVFAIAIPLQQSKP
ncbi:PAS domain S-box protein [Chlorogloeopsis sp. ULAP01]|uniref:PAS domain S-box protein n=1 Tax=Chlorogloeopsis sp. ULAP01 TaxID=3056483 RepID=UPI0025AACE8B|nr:PAS domain S-box protein [Chlorogloeopsis sp. ULAP01]MDM9379387.1 PAS domain S-box protein [Chlorogloeopsis sp. ULAP01]